MSKAVPSEEKSERESLNHQSPNEHRGEKTMQTSCAMTAASKSHRSSVVKGENLTVKAAELV